MQILRKTEEIIYPASSAHPTLFRLSETDQLRYAVPTFHFYKQGPASSEAMKISLSKTLTFYYPFAGRLVERTGEIVSTRPEDILIGVPVGGRMDVSCLDQGAFFCEAWADACLDANYEQNFRVPHPDFDPLVVPGHDQFLLRVQITHFACGGLCLCLECHHCLVDAVSSAHFMKCWVEIARGEERPSMCPFMSHPPLEVMYKPTEFHISDHSTYYEPQPANAIVEQVSNKIFHFTSQFIDNLKSETSDESCKYSSFECISAYMWKSLTLARGIPYDEEVCLYYPVNGRGKLDPPLPPSYLGNVVFRTHASVKVSDLVGKPLSHTTRLLREATSKVTDSHIRSVIEWSTRRTSPMSSRRCVSPHMFLNPLASLPWYEVNLGWGDPSFFRLAYLPFEIIVLLPSPLGKGHMEVLVALNKEHMEKLESLLSQRVLY